MPDLHGTPERPGARRLAGGPADVGDPKLRAAKRLPRTDDHVAAVGVDAQDEATGGAAGTAA